MVLTPLADLAFDIATLVAPIASDEEANRHRWSRRPVHSIAAARCRRRCTSRARRSLGATGRAGIISASTLSGGPRWRVSSRCRNRRWSAGRASNSFARWRPACASPAPASNTRRYGVDTPADLERARRDSLLRSERRRLASHDRQHRLPGCSGRLLRPGLPGSLSGPDDLALRIVRERDGRSPRGTCGPRHAAVREQPGGAGSGYPPPASRIRSVRHRRALPSR